MSVTDPRDLMFDTRRKEGGSEARIGRSAAIVLLFAFAKIILQIGSVAILARLIPPVEYGLFAISMPLISILIGISSFGFVDALVQRETLRHAEASALFWVVAGVGLALAGVTILIAAPMSVFFATPEVAMVLVALAPAVLLSALMGQYAGIFRRQMRIQDMEIRLFASQAGAVTLAVIAALLGASYWALVLQILVQPLLGLGLLAGRSGWRPSRFSLRELPQAAPLLKFGGWLTVSSLAVQISTHVGPIIVGRMFTPLQAALFGRASNLANLADQRAVAPLSSVFLSQFSRTQNDPEAFRSAFRLATLRIALIMLPIGGVLCICADLVVLLLLGPDWTAAAPLLAWMGAYALVSNIAQTCNWSLVAKGAGQVIFAYRAFAAITTTLALVIGASYGLEEMVIARVFSVLAITLPVLIFLCVARTPLQIGDFISTTGLQIFFTVGALWGAWQMRAVLPESGVLAELAIVTGALMVVCVGVALCHPGLRNDLSRIKRQALSATGLVK